MSDAVEKVIIACPKCGKRYRVARTSAGERASCSCGVKFEIPEVEAAGAAERVADAPARVSAAIVDDDPPTPATHCSQHPDVPAARACARCHALICQTCDFPQSDGSHLCPACASEAAGPPASGAVATPVEALHGVRCQRHPEVAAVGRCRVCSAAVCQTCVFQFPGGLNYCPECATNPSRPLSSPRKALVIWSMLMAGWVTLLLAVLLSGALEEAVMEEPGDTIIGILIMIPGLIGIALACGSLSKRAGNPPIVWVTVIWNGILIVAWTILCVIGLMMEGV